MKKKGHTKNILEKTWNAGEKGGKTIMKKLENMTQGAKRKRERKKKK